MVETIKQKLGAHLKALRKKHGFNAAEDLAEEFGVTAKSVYEIERGENWLSADMAERYIKVLGVPLPELFGDPQPPTLEQAKVMVFGVVNERLQALKEEQKAGEEKSAGLGTQADHKKPRR